MNNTNVEKLLGRLLETKAKTAKMGCDVHAVDLAVSIQVEGAQPLRPQRMTAPQLVALCRGLIAAGWTVHCCYETGPCGYGLYRELKALGVDAYVVVAEALGDGRKQKTDNLDAAALCDKLDRYLRGSRKAMTPIRVPEAQEQQDRSEGRLRDELKASVKEWAAWGAVCCCSMAITSKGRGGRSRGGKSWRR